MSTKVGGVTPPQPQLPTQKNEKVYQAAQMYEQQFLREMVKAMRSTVVESELVPTSMGEKIYRQQLDEQYVQSWSERGGAGFADMIYEHIMEKYFNQKTLPMKPLGPMPLEKSKGAMSVEGEAIKIKVKPQEGNGPQAILAPWSGELKQASSEGRNYALIRHDNGLESQIQFSGLATKTLGRVEAGEKIGLQTAGAEDLLWYVKSNT